MRRVLLIIALAIASAGELHAGNRSDNFNRSDGAIIGSTPSDGGSAWVTGGATGWNVSSNRATSGGSGSLCVLEASASDVDVSVTYATTGGSSSNRLGVMVRWVDSSNYLYVYGNGTVYELHKVVAGSDTTVVGLLGTVATGDILRVNAVSTTIKVYLTPSGGGESLLTTQTVSDHSTATKHGLRSAFSNDNLDNFAITDLSSGAPAFRPQVNFIGKLFNPFKGVAWSALYSR